MADLPISAVSPPQRVGDAWLAAVEVRVEGESESVRVVLSDTQRCIAGIVAPSPEWIAARVHACAPLLDSYRPVLDQVRVWPRPLVLYAEPR